MAAGKEQGRDRNIEAAPGAPRGVAWIDVTTQNQIRVLNREGRPFCTPRGALSVGLLLRGDRAVWLERDSQRRIHPLADRPSDSYMLRSLLGLNTSKSQRRPDAAAQSHCQEAEW